ncbi:uncharacterized protein LOC142241992 [Haematobia irritans]|uniref:uncharacterized protein LOC142241992 n=1 Tax=Haematobia irritans TaxID=7368 RepID=UPI003F4FFF4B
MKMSASGNKTRQTQSMKLLKTTKRQNLESKIPKRPIPGKTKENFPTTKSPRDQGIYVKSKLTVKATSGITKAKADYHVKTVKSLQGPPIVSKQKTVGKNKAPTKNPNSWVGPTLRSRQPSMATTTTIRQWGRNNTSSSLKRPPNTKPKDSHKSHENLTSSSSSTKIGIEIGIQTQENEILDPSLVIGDIRFVTPSKRIIDEIEKLRRNIKTQEMLKAKRKFQQHSRRQEEHINDLSEFLDKSYVTKKPRRTRDSFEEERKLFQSMDQLLNREMPKTESIEDIKARIKRKEEELLNLFDTVDAARLAVDVDKN